MLRCSMCRRQPTVVFPLDVCLNKSRANTAAHPNRHTAALGRGSKVIMPVRTAALILPSVPN